MYLARSLAERLCRTVPPETLFKHINSSVILLGPCSHTLTSHSHLTLRKYREMLEKEWKNLAEKHFADAKRAKIEKEGSGEKMKKTLTIMQMIKSALGILHEANDLEKDVKDDIAQIGGK